ncbi:molybdenum cofactor biosynthesis protein B [Venatoribacter cucullus]|uniref:Molybdenum cofactor biosynthesis protein B n=1 Tax=Venatoribacter cucullus TaxID=2661630 RepID=A0A9X7UW01_9GAMM|nr:molybdenum cofactor biosynthesis protein B [Venatoribacter cucullus]QQD23913.1 molybdenum cofactor biosynthesis protein B [Venatoribacter cucullus]
MSKRQPAEFFPLNLAILTLSDSRTAATDSSGDALQQLAESAGHRVCERALLSHNRYAIRALVSQWIASERVQVVVLNGGTGFAAGNCTPEAIRPLFDTEVEGFGELFRQLSYADIGSSSLQSRALAGMANGTLLFAIPGSGGACRQAWEQLIAPQLDSRTGPCNFVAHIKNSPQPSCR